jgi:hypothetical protein
MARQTVLGSQRSGLASLFWLLVGIGLVMFVVKDPTGAAGTAKDIVNWFSSAVDGIAAFFRNVSA